MAIIRSFIERFLDPAEWLDEILIGLIMALTFTLGAGMIVKESSEETLELLQNVVGCNIAWGLINAVMFIMNRLYERSRAAKLIDTLRGVADEKEGFELIQDELDPKLEAITSGEARVSLYRDIFRNAGNVSVPRTRIQSGDIGGALVSLLMVSLTALPAILPFLFLRDRYLALRISNGLLLGVLFLVGYFWGKETNTNPWVAGLTILVIGGAMVGVAVALGG